MLKGKMTVLLGMLAIVLALGAGFVVPVFAGYVDNGDGTVTDKTTHLMWQKVGSKDKSMNWTDAIEYCEYLCIGGHTDWRLPNIHEILSIVDFTRYRPHNPKDCAIDPVFFCSVSDEMYWSGTTKWPKGMISGKDAMYVGFGYGISTFRDKTHNLKVRCVRGGPSDDFSSAISLLLF